MQLNDFINVVIFFLLNAGSTFAGVYGVLYLMKRTPKLRPASVANLSPVDGSGEADAKECRACFEKISARAKRCPYCTSSL